MKKNLIAVIALATVTASTSPAYAADIPDASSLYSQTAVIVNLNYSIDLVTVQTAGGILYDFYGCEDYTINDFVSLMMWDNGTPNAIYDDAVIDAHYAGYSLDNLVDMDTVTDIQTTETGAMIWTADGSGYYWER